MAGCKRSMQTATVWRRCGWVEAPALQKRFVLFAGLQGACCVSVAPCKRTNGAQHVWRHHAFTCHIAQGLEACTRLEELHISQQHAADSPASALTSAPLTLQLEPQVLSALCNTLRVFSAASCSIYDPTPLAALTRLHTLDLSHNALTDLEAVEQLLGALTGLKSLDLRGNPLTQQLRYRDAVILAASDRLVMLDGEPVTAKQREFLLRREMQHLKAQQPHHQQQQQGGQRLVPQGSSSGTGGDSSDSRGKLQFHPLQPPSHRPTAAGGFRAASARAKALRGNSIPCAAEVEDVSLCMGGVAIGSPYSSAGGAL